jgi:hypothetical protein
MNLLLNNCFEVIRNVTLFSAVSLPWQLGGDFELSDKFMFLPKYTPEQEYIQQTLARFLSSLFVPHLALPCAYTNGGLAVAHLIMALRLKRTQEEVENGLIRLGTAAYDLAIHLLLRRSYPYCGWIVTAFHITFTAFPTLLCQFHGFVLQNETGVIKSLAKGVAEACREMNWIAAKSRAGGPPGGDKAAVP